MVAPTEISCAALLNRAVYLAALMLFLAMSKLFPLAIRDFPAGDKPRQEKECESHYVLIPPMTARK